MFGVKAVSVLAVVLSLVLSVLTFPAPHEGDLEGAASGGHHGRVQIKVFRGPTEHSGHEKFAPWGYWVKQPADDHH